MEEKGIVYYLLLDEIKKYAYNKRKESVQFVPIFKFAVRWQDGGFI